MTPGCILWQYILGLYIFLVVSVVAYCDQQILSGMPCLVFCSKVVFDNVVYAISFIVWVGQNFVCYCNVEFVVYGLHECLYGL